ncbi:hypothetical protein Smic_50560 [Streptomyces microflavus]|uniref:DNA-directed RNA polymerase specialized sigma subunit, sigma24 family n=1 Tax=Streptomyces microflavus TaxID=1919 RepID=A0A7J0CVC9_STRMI|nr:hypothetical protein Smic_50560 [Streptomyces microflavus]
MDRDPVGWVRAAAYEYAMSPWHRLRRVHRHPDAPPSEPARRALFEALLDLPPAYRRTLLLYDGVGLDLPETAAETEASTPAAAGRLEVARAAVAERLPELAAAASPAEQSELLQDRLGGLARAEHVPAPSPARTVRTGSEDKARLWTRAAIAFVALLIGATALTLHTAPTHYEQPVSPPNGWGRTAARWAAEADPAGPEAPEGPEGAVGARPGTAGATHPLSPVGPVGPLVSSPVGREQETARARTPCSGVRARAVQACSG